MMPRERPSSYRATEPLARMLHFKWANKRGKATPRLVDYIVLAEFDVDSGRLVGEVVPSSSNSSSGAVV